jgi:hypothetical protein
LLLVKPFYRAFAEPLIGRFTHPTRTVNFFSFHQK